MKVVLELDKQLKDGDLLIYRNGKLCGITINELIPELKEIKLNIKGLQEFQKDADAKIKELRGED